MKTTLIVAIALMVGIASAHCPNGCSGHGTCGANDACTCFDNWQGGDCSQRQCAYDLAWVDTPSADDTAHYYAECSNKGICDRETGECQCFDGYEGKACYRQVCPNACSGKGECLSINALAGATHKTQVVDPVTRAGAADPVYALWDESKVYGCACDPGYTGADCSQRMCPKGDDPLTTTGSPMQQVLRLTSGVAGDWAAGDEIIVTFKDTYGASWTTTAISGTTAALVATSLQTALRKLPNHAMDSATVAALITTTGDTINVGRTAAGAATGATCGDGSAAEQHVCVTITFGNLPGTTGLQYVMECDTSVRGDGFQPKSLGFSGTSPTCTIEEKGTYGSVTYTENAECSGRGTCDTSAGVCECYTGFRGLACENQEALA